MNNKFKGLYHTEKTTFITDKTEPINYYEPIIKTPKIQNYTYSINFDKTELYKEIANLQQELQRKDNIINDLKNFLNGKYDEWKDSEEEFIRESAYEDLRILEYIKELEENK